MKIFHAVAKSRAGADEINFYWPYTTNNAKTCNKARRIPAQHLQLQVIKKWLWHMSHNHQHTTL